MENKIRKSNFNNHKFTNMNLPQKEKLETLLGKELPESTEPLVHREQIKGTPFWIVKNQQGWNLIMGKWKITEQPLPTREELNTWIKENKWNIQLQMIIAITTDINNENKQQWEKQ